jgi:hypothetical protein
MADGINANFDIARAEHHCDLLAVKLSKLRPAGYATPLATGATDLHQKHEARQYSALWCRPQG